MELHGNARLTPRVAAAGCSCASGSALRAGPSTDANETWSETTNSSGYADIRLYNTSSGEAIAVTVGGATCLTTA
jgi:hypothetical protein